MTARNDRLLANDEEPPLGGAPRYTTSWLCGSANRSNGSTEPSSGASDKLGGAWRPTPTQWVNDLAEMHIVLARTTRAESVTVLNQILADTMTLRDLYKKYPGQTLGATLYELHLLFDNHQEEQIELIEAIAEQTQTLGGISIAMASDVAETTMLTRPPQDSRSYPCRLKN